MTSSGGSILARRLYYWLKPHLPWSARISARRVFAQRKRQRFENIWPIDPSSGRAPPGWGGWPEGKQFAFAITHDVEGRVGLDQTLKLLETDAAYGFRSAFNFVPEGDYVASVDLRETVKARGFEVGIHDLHHDGLLFDDRDSFLKKAARINHYLRDWDAVGFRSGFMLRNLEWMHNLEIEYDSSTFDTDPFEFQSEGLRTIFPRFIRSHGEHTPANSDRSGYVELPYTLPQDSTLFLLFQEPSPAIWLKKLDWIAEHGGMALVNVHPDYINFGHRRNNRQFPAAHYIQFLRFVQERYAGQFWNPLPKELARWFRDTHSDLPSFCEVSPSI